MTTGNPALALRTRSRRAIRPCVVFLLGLFLSALPTWTVGQVTSYVFVEASTEQDLRDIIATANSDRNTFYQVLIQVDMLQFSELDGTGSALPPLFGRVELFPFRGQATLMGGGDGSDFRLIEIGNGGGLSIRGGITLDGFQSQSDGGVIRILDAGFLLTGRLAEGDSPEEGVQFTHCQSGNRGGAIAALPGSRALVDRAFFTMCTAVEGGAIAVDEASGFTVQMSAFNALQADAGGAIAARGPVSISTSLFADNRATSTGGALDLRGSGGAQISDSVFLRNLALDSGCHVNLAMDSGAMRTRIVGNVLSFTPCQVGDVGLGIGTAFAGFNTLRNSFPESEDSDILRLDQATFESIGNVIQLDFDGPAAPVKNAAPAKAGCSGTGTTFSLGANIVDDDSCAFNHPNDLLNTALQLVDVDGVPGIGADSVAVDRGPFGLIFIPSMQGIEAVLPCGYRDIRGLGRPQDGDGDGVFRCDSGAFEVQGGPDIGSAQTAAYYDTSRSGEGVFVDMIGGGLATVSVFSYGPDGGMAWFTGLGNVVGNSVVVDDLDLTSGGRFGAAFNPASITRERVGGLSLVFPDCEAGSNPGRLVFQPALGSAFDPLSVLAQRLTRVVPCSGTPGPFAGLSGGWYAPARSGEGLFLEFQPDGSIVVVFYSYTPQGELFWAIAGEASFDGTTLTASMLYPAGTTRFGSNFVSSEVNLQPWGTITMRFTGCHTADFSWNSTVPGYGSGGFAYQRLTQPSGTSCPE